MAAETPICDFGWKAVDFQLRGIDGRTYGLPDVRGPNGLLVMFICNHCPYVQAVVDRLVATVDELRQHGIGSIAIMSNDTEAYPEDSFDHMVEFAAAHRFGFPYVIDETQAVARAYDAVCTPDFFGFNADLELQYRGRLDASRKQAVDGAEPELLNAMIQVARTGQGPHDQIPSMGCSIKWRDPV
ncbi:thioredoxin family protein [Indioceanicola profundi]|uniref:thioredoxin family protein n=1 Tax=Indioceanicola profundi TaxID=2220096 RepID=UPI000E6AB1F3|nr:thioredoxin family protein [Indioceanicola profundi]